MFMVDICIACGGCRSIYGWGSHFVILLMMAMKQSLGIENASICCHVCHVFDKTWETCQMRKRNKLRWVACTLYNIVCIYTVYIYTYVCIYTVYIIYKAIYV